MFWTILISVLTLTASTGAALGAALGLTGLIILHFFAEGATSLALNAVWNVLNEFTLSAIPLFIIMGEILLESGVSQKIYGSLSGVFRNIPGGLLHTNIAVCTVFGAISGSSLATAAAVGSVAYPEMSKRNYNEPMVVGSLAGGGTLGLLIPPSLSLLIYGALTETSIGKLFMGGILPGILMAFLFMLYIFIRCTINPKLWNSDTNNEEVLNSSIVDFLKIWPIGFLIFAVMGSIVLGIATPTEAAGVGVISSLLLGLFWGDLSKDKIFKCFYNSAITYGSIGFVVVGAVILAQSISILGIPQELIETIQNMGMSKYYVLSLIVLIYLMLGCLFDGLSLMVMTLPIVFPLMTNLGFDPVWLGVIITIMIEIGQITPPVGLNLSVLVAVTDNKVGLGETAIATSPYWLLLLFGILIVTIFPSIVLYIPNNLM
ncbi:MAG: TRAP transporter large permease [Deltaproteobacteria bacterium]|jgi:tripartite ATP-independent transporter DctM subunit|nr:TRAP transporter large permease [Deltaproteobacteria bacterium]